jgi:hypothetical protein
LICVILPAKAAGFCLMQPVWLKPNVHAALPGRGVTIVETAAHLTKVDFSPEVSPLSCRTSQNALTQVRAFDEALGLTGLIVTKLDGTAKGGVLAAIAREFAQAILS